MDGFIFKHRGGKPLFRTRQETKFTIKQETRNDNSPSLHSPCPVVIQSDLSEVCGAAAAATPALQKHPAGATVCRTLEISARRHPGAAHRPKRCEFIPLPQYVCVQFLRYKPLTLRSALTWVVQTAFSDVYLGYTTTLASFLSLEFNRLNRPEDSSKVQVLYSADIM